MTTPTAKEILAQYPNISQDILERNGLADAPSSRHETQARQSVKSRTGTENQPIPLEAYKRPGPVATHLGTTVIVTFDSLPPSELYKNKIESSHWRVRHSATKAARQEGLIAAGPLAGVGGKAIQICKIEVVVTMPDNRDRDLSGMLCACNAWIDGIVDAGVIVDDKCKNVRGLSIRPVWEKGVSKTQIIITELSS
jgi:hypothetical protein